MDPPVIAQQGHASVRHECQVPDEAIEFDGLHLRRLWCIARNPPDRILETGGAVVVARIRQ